MTSAKGDAPDGQPVPLGHLIATMPVRCISYRSNRLQLSLIQRCRDSYML